MALPLSTPPEIVFRAGGRFAAVFWFGPGSVSTPGGAAATPGCACCVEALGFSGVALSVLIPEGRVLLFALRRPSKLQNDSASAKRLRPIMVFISSLFSDHQRHIQSAVAAALCRRTPKNRKILMSVLYAAEQGNRMRQDRFDNFETLTDGFRRAGQINDQGS